MKPRLLTDHQVEDMRETYAQHRATRTELAAKYEVSLSVIDRSLRGVKRDPLQLRVRICQQCYRNYGVPPNDNRSKYCSTICAKESKNPKPISEHTCVRCGSAEMEFDDDYQICIVCGHCSGGTMRLDKEQVFHKSDEFDY